MTNREWLNSLSDEEFAIWCCEEDRFDVSKDNKFIPVQPYPRLHGLKMQCTSSAWGVTQWLKEKRVEEQQ